MLRRELTSTLRTLDLHALLLLGSLTRFLRELLEKEGTELVDHVRQALRVLAHVALQVDRVDELEGGRLPRLVQGSLGEACALW